MDAEEHPSSKDPSASDSQEPPVSEDPLKASISETPLEPLSSETPLEPSTSQNPLETHTSETHLEPSIPETPLEPLTSPLEPPASQNPLEPHTPESHVTPSTSHTPLETHTSETPLEPSISKASLERSIPESPSEIHISKVPEKQLTSHNASPGHVSRSPSDTLKEGPISEPPSSDVSQTRRSMQIPQSESLQKHSLSGPSAQVHPDTSAKEKEEEENKDGVNATDRATHTAQSGHQLGKKKEKKGVDCNCSCRFPHSHHCLSPAPGEGDWVNLRPDPPLLVLGPPLFLDYSAPVFPGYRVSPAVATKQAEMVKVANTVHRGMFGAQVKNLFQWEKNAALSAIQTGEPRKPFRGF